ncbi:MAG: LssY C-terminal domain-containing protein [Xanthobacteraceae bacterium]
MARQLIRFLQRMGVVALGVFSVWLIVFVFRLVDRRLPSLLALAFCYGVAAYLILPQTVHLGLRILRRKYVPSYTLTGDGLPGDPVNVVLIGTLAQLRSAFAAAGWSQADRLGFASSWRMVLAFVFNRPYPAAPFSTLYLFGRAQDIGFQKEIGDSPRKRHHVRFWALSISHEVELGQASFWQSTLPPPAAATALWVGAGTKDTGFSLTRLTFQITHATDADADEERDHIVADLSSFHVIGEATLYRAGQHLPAKRINHYITDGELTLATLTIEA